MTPYEKLITGLTVITILVSLFAIVISFFALRNAKRARMSSENMGNTANEISMAELQTIINDSIATTKLKALECATAMAPLLAKKRGGTITPEESDILDQQNQLFDATVEINLNAYDSACARYEDAKVDKVRFKKEYYEEIKALVERESLRKYFNPDTSKFQNILRVFREWRVN